VAIGLNPLPTRRWWRGQREIENGDPLSLLTAPTDPHNFFSGSQVHAFDPDCCPKDLRRKRDRQMLFEHREESNALF
jgi:hypothetical protein